jgi:hypothetical protein
MSCSPGRALDPPETRSGSERRAGRLRGEHGEARVSDVRIELSPSAGEVCRSILGELPDWFGIAEANEAYARAAEEHTTLVAIDGDGRELGLITVVEHA